MNTMKKPELLCPAGNPEKLSAALRFGADAVYLAGKSFGMRSAADNFTVGEIKDAAAAARKQGAKIYLTVNVMPHGYEYPALKEYLYSLSDTGIDGVIAADLGVIALVREILPEVGDTRLHSGKHCLRRSCGAVPQAWLLPRGSGKGAYP